MKRLLFGLLALALPAFAWACTDAGAGSPEDQYDNHVVSNDPLATETVALSFFTTDTTTACGVATGMRVTIADNDETLVCVAPWAPAMISDPYTAPNDYGIHYVADCFFVVAPGTWQVLGVETLGMDGQALPCCTAEYPATVEIVSGQTSELGVEMQCALTGPGALDIYGYLERPPIVKDLDIYPSKFGGPCVPRFFYAQATDIDGDFIVYDWEVVSSPTPLGFKLWEHGPLAIFVGYHVGDYMLRLTVSDEPHGMFTSLDFPIHVTLPIFGPNKSDTDRPTGCGDIEPTVPAEAGFPAL